jgi:lysozyme family protein
VTVEAIIDGVIGAEAGSRTIPTIPGGPTMWGITERVARANGYTGRWV